MTFVGQFIDHDLRLDATSPLAAPTRPEATVNRRSPAFDLDSVYGSGPFGGRRSGTTSSRRPSSAAGGGSARSGACSSAA
jgi:hypothetical protein